MDSLVDAKVRSLKYLRKHILERLSRVPGVGAMWGKGAWSPQIETNVKMGEDPSHH